MKASLRSLLAMVPPSESPSSGSWAKSAQASAMLASCCVLSDSDPASFDARLGARRCLRGGMASLCVCVWKGMFRGYVGRGGVLFNS